MKLLKGLVIGILCFVAAVVGFIVIFIPNGLFAFYAILSVFLNFTRDASLDSKYSEIYAQRFEIQQELFIYQKEGNDFVLTADPFSDEKIEKGSTLRVKKILSKDRWAGRDVTILVDIEGSKLYSNKKVDAVQLSTESSAGCFEIAEFDPKLLRNVNIQTLRQAIQYEDLDAVKRLINDKELREKRNGEIPLFIARKPEIIAFLLDNSDIRQTDSSGNTLLHLAILENKPELIPFLLERGAPLEQKNRFGNTPLFIAFEQDNAEVIDLLLKAGADLLQTNQAQNTLVHIAVRNENLEMTRRLLNAGVPVNSVNREGESALHYAVANLPLLKLLIEYGADIQQVDGEGRSVLHWACRQSNLEIIQLLFQQGAQINLPDNEGNTPLSVAATSYEALTDGTSTIIIWLIDHGADVPQTNHAKSPPLCLLVYYGQMDLIKLLVSHGADIHQTNDQGSTLLHFASAPAMGEDNLQLVEWLIDQGVDIHQTNHEGLTPLDYASDNRNEEIVQLLIAKGAVVK